MPIGMITKTERWATCVKCGYSWKPRVQDEDGEKPKCCPKCTSYQWE